MLIKGGYYAFSKKLLNVTLKPTNVWHTGLILTNKNLFITRLNPARENKLELIQHKDMAVLLLNNGIIYEDKKLFTYNIDLALTDETDETDNNFLTLKDRVARDVEYKFISCKFK